MKSESILAMFYSNENNLVFDNIKRTSDFSEEKTNQLKMLSFKFLGPLFLSSAKESGNSWKIDSIESSLSMQSKGTRDVDILQTFFCLNSFVDSEDRSTILSSLIGSSYTEDIKMLYNKLSKYLHPSIVQGKVVNESIMGSEFNANKFLRDELQRGADLIDFSLGSQRKMYWEEQQQYLCIGVIERKTEFDRKITNLYTFSKEDLLKKSVLQSIPSFYLLSILPDYYEKLVNETLDLFNKNTVLSNIQQIELSTKSTKAVYIEEFIIEKDIKSSYGVILIPSTNGTNADEAHNIAYFKKKIRLILDLNKILSQILPDLNKSLIYKSWKAVTEDELTNIKINLDDLGK